MSPWMVSRRARWVGGIATAQILLLAITFPIPGFGAETWHHMASLAGVLGLAALLHRPLRRSRRFLAVGVLATAILASLSGFYLIYWKAGIRVEGFQDWAVWWHVTWSWMVTVFFVQHTWVNRVAFVHFVKKTLVKPAGTVVHAGAYLAVVVAIAVSWSPSGRELFTNANYVPLSLWVWVLVLVPPYLTWLYLRRRHTTGDRPLETRFGHWPVRRLVDLMLVPIAALAILSGFPLLFDGPFDAAGLKYATKTWHVWPSILFTVLAFIHGVQAWSTVKVHWRKLARS